MARLAGVLFKFLNPRPPPSLDFTAKKSTRLLDLRGAGGVPLEVGVVGLEDVCAVLEPVSSHPDYCRLRMATDGSERDRKTL